MITGGGILLTEHNIWAFVIRIHQSLVSLHWCNVRIIMWNMVQELLSSFNLKNHVMHCIMAEGWQMDYGNVGTREFES